MIGSQETHAMKTPRYFLAAVLAVLILATVTTVASATPGSGQTPSNLAAGRLNDTLDVNTDRIKFKTKGATDVAMFTVTYAPGGYSGWHVHPGIVFVVVKSGTVLRTVQCGAPRPYGVGESFVESDEQPGGEVRNASATEPAVLQVTQVVPQGSVRRVEAAQPAC
jgi:quercetin dioxygenase-like cupin family protein